MVNRRGGLSGKAKATMLKSKRAQQGELWIEISVVHAPLDQAISAPPLASASAPTTAAVKAATTEITGWREWRSFTPSIATDST